MNRLPSPSAVVAAMLPFNPGGTTCPVANFAQSAGSNFIPAGSACGASNRGSMPEGPTVETWYCDPKLHLTFPTLAMFAVDWADPPVAHAASAPAHATASTAFGLTIVANVPNRLDSSAQRGDRFHQQRGGEVLAQWGIRRPWVGDDRDKGEVVAEVGAVRVRL